MPRALVLLPDEPQPQQPGAHLELGVAPVAGLHPGLAGSGRHAVALPEQVQAGLRFGDREGVQHHGERQILGNAETQLLLQTQRLRN